MADFPNDTGPVSPSKVTTYDVNTSQSPTFVNGAELNARKAVSDAMVKVLVGSYRGWCEPRSSGTLTAVRMHTAQAFVDGYLKTLTAGSILVPGVTGTTIIAVQWNPTGVAAAVATYATGQAPYSTTGRVVPIARNRITGGVQTVEMIRPDWVFGAGL